MILINLFKLNCFCSACFQIMSGGQDVLDMEDTQRLLNTTTRDTDRNARLRNLLRKYDVIPVKNNLDDFEEKYSEVCYSKTFACQSSEF